MAPKSEYLDFDACWVLQVCLAAETCGHVDFNTRGDVWYSSEPFHCGDVPPGHVTYWQIFYKVLGRLQQPACLHACMHGQHLRA
jgi:hypothetical protein